MYEDKTLGMNILRRLVLIITTSLHHLFHKFGIDLAATHTLHHGQMFEVVVSLKERITRIEFHQDAANTPDITGETPSQIQDDLRGPIMPSGDNRGVILIVKGGRSEVDQANLRVEQNSTMMSIADLTMRR